ncbi:MAG: DUF3048 domain-containing protein [Ruthenibacterium sp.]
MKKILAVTLSMVLLLGIFTACGKKKDETSPSSVTPAPSSSEPKKDEPPYTPNPLTGLENKGEYPDGKRFAAVMINNIAGSTSQNARPQWGLSAADVLVEIKVEGGITRFMGLFPDYAKMPQVGPVRSARDQFFQLILPYQPLYVHIGESTVQSEFKRDYEYESLDLNLDKYGYPRDNARKSTGVAIEHTAYTNGDNIKELVDKNNIDDKRTYKSPIFDFVNYNEPEHALTGDDAYKIDIMHSQGYRTYFTWDAAGDKYKMSQYSMAKGGVHDTIDANTNEQVGFDNVLVLFADIYTHPNYVNEHYDIQKVDYNAGGVGYYFCNGQSQKVRWMKGGPQEILRILDGDGNETPVQLNPGKTYLTMVDVDEAIHFTYYQTEAAATGTGDVTVDSAKVDTGFVDADA